MGPNKKQQRAKLSNIMCLFFSSLGVVIFWVGFKVARPSLSALKQKILRRRIKSTLPQFTRPAPHLLQNHATVPQVDAYINSTTGLGSMKYTESESCKKFLTCEIHFPFLDMDDLAASTNTLENLRTNGNANQRTDYAVLTRKGFKALVTNVNSNQDRAFVLAPLELTEESAIPVGPDDFLIGLFDGHGSKGHGTSHFAAMELPPLVFRNMQRRRKFIHSRKSTDGITAAIKDAFISLDDNIPFLETSGSTGILILRIGTSLFMASTGDSQAFLIKAELSTGASSNGSSPKLTIVQSTTPHKPDQPMESARIRSAGGQVLPKVTEDTSSRVIIPVEEGMTLALAMSRSLGDPEGKKANVIIADPTVDVIDLYELQQQKEQQQQQQEGDAYDEKYFIIVASDGLLDKIRPLDVAERIAKSFYLETPPHPLLACHELIERASKLWMTGEMGYRDDISIAVKMVDL
jgi:serine/threonine protein phosphatase PrpC